MSESRGIVPLGTHGRRDEHLYTITEADAP